jgi:hypothetical protein
LDSLEVERIDGDRALITATFSNRDGSRTNESCSYSRNDFTNVLWTIKNPKGEALLSGTFERDRLYESSLGKPFEVEPAFALTPSTPPVSGKEKNTLNKDVKPGKSGSAKAASDGQPHPKFKALKKMLDSMRPQYKSTTDPAERSFMETVVGAAVFYLPTSVDHFSGHMSRGAIAGYLEGKRIVKDHILPRKLAGRTLLESEFSLEDIVQSHHNRLAVFMYVSAEENSLLVNYYEDHADHDEAMKALGIDKFPPTAGDRFRDHREKREFLKSLSGLKGEVVSLDLLEKRLRQFRKEV